MMPAQGAAALDAMLAQMQVTADPPADRTVARIVGAWKVLPPGATAQELHHAHQAQWDRLQQATALLQQLGDNASLAHWRADLSRLDFVPDADMVRAVEDFVHEQQALPEWADPAQLARAEAMFMDHGPLSCILLFCASLPECYVLPDLSAVLHLAGQLEQRTEYRIRSTAAMIFPVMMRGGMGGDAGTGRAQVLKVRLIHATIRNLILHGCPEDIAHAMAAPHAAADAGVVAPLPALQGERSMQAALFGAGWDVGCCGIPCDQEELGYTLLTFSYVFLRSMRKLGLRCAPADEAAFLHTWNVVAHVLGVRGELMAHTMDDAAVLFTRMQQRDRRSEFTHDPRPALGQALMRAMETSIPITLLKPFGTLMTLYLCGRRTAGLIGVTARAPMPSRMVFFLLMVLTRGIDTLARLVWPDFSIARLITRVLGYRLITRLLMNQTRSLQLPTRLLNPAQQMLDAWGSDPHAPQWMNTLEDKMTVKGSWRG